MLHIPSRDDLASARQAIGTGNNLSAAATSRRIISSSPTSAEAHHILALSLFRQGSVQDALAPAARAVALDPNYAEAHHTLGVIFQKLGKPADAETSLKAALAVKPDYVEALNQLGLLFQDTKRLPEAEAVLRRAVAFRPDFANAHDSLGFVLREMGKSSEAASSFRQAHSLFEPHLALNPAAGPLARGLGIGLRYAKVSLHILRWLAGAKLGPKALTDYRLLHQATNGKSSDNFSSLVARFSRQKGAASWRQSEIFSWIEQKDFSTIMDSLKRDGLYVFDRPLPSGLVDEMVEFAKTNPARLYPMPADGQALAVFDPSNPLAGGYRFEEQPLLQQPCFQKMMGDPLLEAVTQAYLGVESKLAYISLWWSAVFERNPTSHMAQLYHVDLSHMKWLIMFVYLTDVSDSTGHHTFVCGSHQNDQEGLELRARGLVRVCDEDIERVYRKDNIKDLVGPRGTVFIADTRAFHKGNMPRTGHRLMFQLYHVNSLFPDHLEKSRERTIHVADPILEEIIKLHPGKFDGYSVVSGKSS